MTKQELKDQIDLDITNKILSNSISPTIVGKNLKDVVDIDSRPYKVYTALVSQSGTNAPVATVLENTLGGTIVWSYDSVGIYVATLTGVFINNKTTVHIQHQVGTVEKEAVYCIRVGVDAIAFHSHSDLTTTVLNNDVISNTTIEIRVYN